MYKNSSTSALVFGLAIFAGLLPASFTFSGGTIHLLIETQFKYFAWCAQFLMLVLLLLGNVNFNKNKWIGLAIFYLLVPFTFTFTDDGISFLILNKYVSTLLSWLIAGTCLGKLYFASNVQEKDNR